MKKLFVFCIAVMLVLLPMGAAMAETIMIYGTVINTQPQSVVCTSDGTIEQIHVAVGDRVAAGEVIATVTTNKVYAATDGTVYLFGEAGDQVSDVTAQYGAVAYIAPSHPYTITANATDRNGLAVSVVPGETVYLRCYKDGKHKGVGILAKTEKGGYTVVVTEGEFETEETISVYRDPAYTDQSRIGRAKVTIADMVACKGEGYLVKFHVQNGTRVEKGALLYETISGTVAPGSTQYDKVIAPTNGIVSAVYEKAGSQLNFDEELYNKHSYTRWLTELLVENTIMQQSYTGEGLSFDTPVFRSCLERCQMIGNKLHAIEGKPAGGRLPLVEVNNQSVANFRHFICLRLDENQPLLISAEMRVGVASADSDHVDMAAAFALNQLQYDLENSSMTALLFSDPQPVENPDYAQSVARVQQQLEEATKQLDSAANASAQKKAKLQEQVESCKRQLEQVSDPSRAYLIPEADLAEFRHFEGHLYFEAPSVFAVGTEYGDMLEQLLERYSTGVTSVEQFVQQLEEISWMLQMEVE